MFDRSQYYNVHQIQKLIKARSYQAAYYWTGRLKLQAYEFPGHGHLYKKEDVEKALEPRPVERTR